MLDSKRNKIFSTCVGISFFAHSLFVVFLQTHCLWFSSPVKTSTSASSASTALEQIVANDVLKEAFSAGGKETATAVMTPAAQEITQTFNPATASFSEPPTPTFVNRLKPLEDFLAEQTPLFPIHTFQLPAIKPFDLFADLPKELLLPTLQKKTELFLVKPQIETLSPVLKSAAPINVLTPIETAISFLKEPAEPVNAMQPLVKAIPTIPVPSLPHLPSLADLQTVNLSDSFESELTFLPRTDGPGYVFALTLLPKAKLSLPKIRQNVVFLIDKSNSIQRERLQSTKQAIHRAIEELGADVHYNVIAFDSKMEKLFPSLTAASSESKQRMSRFLDNISLGSLFSVADLHKALFLTIPTQVQEDELYTAILLTDGESLSKKQMHRSLLHDWTLQNRGRVSLFAVGITGDQHTASLDAACSINKGKFISSTTNRGLKRKLMRLAKNIRSPIAKNILPRAISRSPRNHIEIHSNPSYTPHLYLDQPYVIVGTTDTLDDFVLFIQARLKDGWLNIKKNLSFTQAKKGSESLQAELALQAAYRQYELYIQDDNPAHLAEAKQLLTPFHIPAIQ